MRRKGELSPAAIDRDWPHHVVLPAARHAVRDNVYCFADPADAEKFKQRFGAERFNPSH